MQIQTPYDTTSQSLQNCECSNSGTYDCHLDHHTYLLSLSNICSEVLVKKELCMINQFTQTYLESCDS